jgi:hypothetical protein
MKQLVLTLFILTTSMMANALPMNVASLARVLENELGSLGHAPAQDDCNCDGEDDQITPSEEVRHRPLISFSFGIESDGNGDREVSSYDCSSSSKTTEIDLIVDQLTNLDHAEYMQYISENTSDFSAEDKICLANKFGRLGNDNYTMSDGVGLYTLDEMHSCMQQSANGDYESCRTCAPIHHYTASAIESMGGKCGLMVNQWDAPPSDTQDNSRFMHYVNICKLGDKFHMINYSFNYQLDAMTYQEAIDIANIGLAEGNWAGNQITCMEPGKSSLKDCKHVYLSRSTRYQLSQVRNAIDQVGSENSPISIALTNLRQEILVATPISSSSSTEVQRDGDIEVTNVTHAMTAELERYRGENFGQIGYIRKSQTIVSDPNSSDGPKRESQQNLYIGVVGSSGNGSYYLNQGEQDYSSILFYLDREDAYHLDPNDDLVMNYDVVFGSDLANISRPGENAGLGQTNVFSLKWGHQINDSIRSELTQRFSIMTDRANIPLPQLGSTTLSLDQEFLPNSETIKLSNKSSIHFLHGGFRDETFAFQNSTNLLARNIGPSGFDIELNTDIGYTTNSVTGRDIFYDSGLWAEGNFQLTQPIFDKGNKSLFISVDGGLTTGSRPSQFGIDPLTIEEAPTRQSINAGYNGFIKLGGSF